MPLEFILWIPACAGMTVGGWPLLAWAQPWGAKCRAPTPVCGEEETSPTTEPLRHGDCSYDQPIQFFSVPLCLCIKHDDKKRYAS